MDISLLKVAFANDALYLPGEATASVLSEDAAKFISVLAGYGRTPDEDCLHHLNALTKEEMAEVAGVIGRQFLADFNWAALTLEWNERPTGVTFLNFLVTALHNINPGAFGTGVTLPCGHFIPDGVFDLSRYTGCPFCGTSFATAKANLDTSRDDQLKVLSRWGRAEAEAYAIRLATSLTPLDATQSEHLRLLADGLPEDFFLAMADIPLSETRAAIAETFLARGDARFVQFADTPNDLLRILWSATTGKLRFESVAHARERLGDENIRLHFSRTIARAVARRIEDFNLSAEETCTHMHRYRQMWVRFIRALRLPDNARRYHLTKLAEILDRFYNKDYDVWAGDVEKARAEGNRDELLALLCRRPGEFARRLFDTALDFGIAPVTDTFRKIAPRIPLRLLISLYNNVPGYFMPDDTKPRRIVLPGNKIYKGRFNRALLWHTDAERHRIASQIMQCITECIMDNYSSRKSLGDNPIYISPELRRCPTPIGDRGTTTVRTGHAIPGQHFPVKGDKVRLFLHWGIGLDAQHYDMDLSCRIYKGKRYEDISYYNLNVDGTGHSGDIQHIPDRVGAAEYIELNLPRLLSRGYTHAIFTANAYSCPKLAPDMVVGWMSSEKPMKVDDTTGVSYDPADVDVMVNVAGLSEDRGMVFGILDIKSRSIMWLEIATDDRRLDQIDMDMINNIQQRLSNKCTIAELIELRAKMSGNTISTTAGSDSIVYNMSNWQDADIL